MQSIEFSNTIIQNDETTRYWNSRSEDSPIGAFPDEVLELVRWSRFTGPTGPFVGCILLSLDLAFQEHLVRGDSLGTCSSHIEIASASGPRHVEMNAPWLRMVKSLVDGWKNSPAAQLVDVRIVSAVIW